ncbi:HD domain-containing protein [Candidatus Peribacteria bacterium]|nr:HD domain-containing protein [Candidatus Peribacteria bacterium]
MQWQEFRSQIRHLSARDTGRVEKAFQLGKKMHDGQKRHSGEPYFSHPIAVAHILSDLGADADTIIAALLHDTVEDTTLTLPEIDAQFDGAVATLIDGVTKLNSDDIPISPKLDEQIETLRKIFTLMEQDIRIMVIKLVDRLHNMQTIEFLSPERQMTMAKETLEFFVKIADKLCMQDLRDELEALCLSVLEPELLRKLLDIRVQNEQRGNPVIDDMRSRIRAQDSILSSRTGMLFEYKTWNQLKAQLTTGSSVATGVTSLTIAFVCDDVDSCYRVLGMLHQLWKREAMSFQDFINAPQLNGYQGIHTTIIAQDGTRVRCKIRTREMQQYARRGVATVCFKGNSNITAILPWIKNIPELTSDTEGSSKDFWRNLKSDILEESIIIYGPDDRTVRLPKESTALDGVFYLFPKRRTRTASIMMNGVVVPFSHPLSNSASIDITAEDHATCTKDWLQYVKTGFATAKIHAALSEQPYKEKLIIGREMLQEIFMKNKRGFIEEFDEATIKEHLRKFGYSSLNNIYILIAEGRLKPSDIYAALFGTPIRHRRTKTPSFLLRYKVDMKNFETMDRMNLIHRKYGSALSDIHYNRVDGDMANVSLRVHLSPQELAQFQSELVLAGADRLTIVRQNTELALLSAVIILWALNPVIAKWFLLRGMTPLSLVTIRFLTFFAYTTTFYITWRMFSRKIKYTPVPHLILLTTLPALGLIGMSFFNYFALTKMPPSLHLTILRLNTLVLPIMLSLRKGVPFRTSSLFTFLVFILLLILTANIPGAPSITGLMLSMMALFSYMLYSLMSEYVLQQKQISVRYPLFVAYLGLLIGIAGLLLLPWQHKADILNAFTLLAILYMISCVCIPHMLYSHLLRRASFSSVTDIFLLEVPFAVGFEVLLLGLKLPLPIYLIIGFILAVVLLRRWKHVSQQIL